MVIVLVQSIRIPSISIDFLRLPTNLFQILLRKICLRLYLHSLVCRKVSTSYVNSVYSSTQLFFTHVLKRPFNMHDIPRVKNSKKLPSLLSFSEITSILDATTNLKHKAILMTAYSAGLRVSEVLALKVSDIHSENMQIHVRSGKGDF